MSEREDESSGGGGACSCDPKQKGSQQQQWRSISAPPNFVGPRLSTLSEDNELELLKSKRICRSEPCIFMRNFRLSTLCQRLRRTRSRMGGRRSTASYNKNDGIINVLRRRALSRHFSNSFASSLDVSSASQNSSGLYLPSGQCVHQPSPLDACNVLQVLNSYSRSASSGYASRRSSLTGSPFPAGDAHCCTAWSDVSNSGNYGGLPASSTPKSENQLMANNVGSLHSLITGTIGDVENEADVTDNSPSLLGQLYSVRFPKLKRQMESRLNALIARMESNLDYHHTKSSLLSSDGTARFVYCHILEMAKDCLKRCGGGDEKSTSLEVDYFNSLSDKLQRMLHECQEKLSGAPNSVNLIATCVDEFLLAVARTADVLECLDSNPNEFYCALAAVENQLNVAAPDPRDIPRYLVSQLKTSISLNGQNAYTRLLDEYRSDSFNTDASEQSSSSVDNLPTMDDFSILKRISTGSYGSVFLVQHKTSGKYMALKRISKRFVCRKNFIQQVFMERDILTFIRNPFVVSLLCSFETEHDLCLVMEYVEGGDVRSLLDYVNGPLSVDMATLYFAETTLAIEYIHSYGIVHRDIKPSNLLITAHGHIKLTDFGLSRIGLTDLTSSQFHDNQVIGTPQYIAPEVILRTGYGQPVDWWSMGILLYEMLVGCTPFAADDVESLFEQIVNGELEWPDYLLDTPAKELIEMLLRRNPSQRPHYIRNHKFFDDIDWDQLLVRKAQFVPVLDGPDDTSYFQQSHSLCNTTGSAINNENSEDVIPHFYFSSYSPSFKNSVSSTDRLANMDSTSESGGSICSSVQNLSIGGGALDVKGPSTPALSRKAMVAAAAVASSKPKGKRFRGGLLRARSFFFKRVLAADKKMNDLLEIRINRDNIGFGFTFATYSSTKEQGQYVHQILSVISGGPACKAGLCKGHTIVQINHKDVSNLSHACVLRLVQRATHVLHITLSIRNSNCSTAEKL